MASHSSLPPFQGRIKQSWARNPRSRLSIIYYPRRGNQPNCHQIHKLCMCGKPCRLVQPGSVLAHSRPTFLHRKRQPAGWTFIVLTADTLRSKGFPTFSRAQKQRPVFTRYTTSHPPGWNALLAGFPATHPTSWGSKPGARNRSAVHNVQHRLVPLLPRFRPRLQHRFHPTDRWRLWRRYFKCLFPAPQCCLGALVCWSCMGDPLPSSDVKSLPPWPPPTLFFPLLCIVMWSLVPLKALSRSWQPIPKFWLVLYHLSFVTINNVSGLVHLCWLCNIVTTMWERLVEGTYCTHFTWPNFIYQCGDMLLLEKQSHIAMVASLLLCIFQNLFMFCFPTFPYRIPNSGQGIRQEKNCRRKKGMAEQWAKIRARRITLVTLFIHSVLHVEHFLSPLEYIFSWLCSPFGWASFL